MFVSSGVRSEYADVIDYGDVSQLCGTLESRNFLLNRYSEFVVFSVVPFLEENILERLIWGH